MKTRQKPVLKLEGLDELFGGGIPRNGSTLSHEIGIRHTTYISPAELSTDRYLQTARELMRTSKARRAVFDPRMRAACFLLWNSCSLE